MLGLLVLLAAPALAQDQRPRTFMLMNRGPATILSVEISPAGEGQFGPSLIGRVELPPGNALHITPPSGSRCVNDMRVRWSGGRQEERRGEDLCRSQHVLMLSTPDR